MKQIRTDLGKLVLRIGVGGLLLFHGVYKLLHGFEGIRSLLAANNLPDWLWIGVPLAEVIAPICILLGFFTRISSLFVVIMMIFSIYLAFGMSGFRLGEHGAPIIELNLLYLASALALFFVGAGKYALYKRETGLLA